MPIDKTLLKIMDERLKDLYDVTEGTMEQVDQTGNVTAEDFSETLKTLKEVIGDIRVLGDLIRSQYT